jgi:hypothetical protein
LREAGDIIQAIVAGVLTADRLTDVADLAGLPPVPGIGVFKGVGMGWQDLAVSEAPPDGAVAGNRHFLLS